MPTYNRNIGQNRGRPRIWLEKAVLLDNGFNYHDKIKIVNEADRMIIQVDPFGDRTVSGSTARPVIDLSGAVIERSFNTSKVKAVTVRALRPGRLEITPA
jgi:DNA (cytosine-5)-methyltransferase 1